MNNVLLTIKTDAETKEQLKAFAAELGVSSTAVVNMVVKQALRERRIVLSTELEPTPYLEDVIREADADYSANRNITHTKGEKAALAHLDELMSK
jgi:antitoxin component of RelBE/YafQ-DinJ toxin-antitoxin module